MAKKPVHKGKHDLKTLSAIIPEVVPNDAKFVEVRLGKSGTALYTSLYNPAIDDFEMCNINYSDMLAQWADPKHIKIWEGLFTLIASGMPMESAASRVSIPPSYLRNWYNRGRADVDRNVPSAYAWVAMQLDKAEAFGMEVHLQKIMASPDPAISLKFLEKRFPNHFNQQQEQVIQHKFTDSDIDQPTQDNIDKLLLENIKKKK